MVTIAKSFDGERYNDIVHIPKEDPVPMARFNGVHYLHVDPEENPARIEYLLAQVGIR